MEKEVKRWLLSWAAPERRPSSLKISRNVRRYLYQCRCIPTKFLVHKAKEALNLDSFETKAALYTQAMDGKNLSKVENVPNVSVLTDTARLVSAHEVEVRNSDGTEILTGENIFLNTCSVPVIPAIDGVEGNPNVETSEGLLALKSLPRKLIIIGGGYKGVIILKS